MSTNLMKTTPCARSANCESCQNYYYKILDEAKKEEQKKEEPKKEEPKKEEPKKEEPKKEEPKKEEPKKEEPKKEESKKEEPQKEEPQKEEPKKVFYSDKMTKIALDFIYKQIISRINEAANDGDFCIKYWISKNIRNITVLTPIIKLLTDENFNVHTLESDGSDKFFIVSWPKYT